MFLTFVIFGAGIYDFETGRDGGFIRETISINRFERIRILAWLMPAIKWKDVNMVKKLKFKVYSFGANVFGRVPRRLVFKLFPVLYKRLISIRTCTFAKPGDTVVQVGVDFGVKKDLSNAILLSNRVGEKGKVIAIEPDPRNTELLKDYLSKKNIHNTVVIEKAAWKEKGKMTFKWGEETWWSRLEHVHTSTSENRFIHSTEVDADTIDNILDENKIGEIAQVCISVNGAEIEVLEGMRRTLSNHNPKLLIQANHSIRPLVDGVPYLEAISSRLEAYGYTIIDAKRWIAAEKK